MTPTRIHELLALRAAQTPDAVFLHETTGKTTYAALQSLVDAAAHDLLDAGVRPTDRVLLVAERRQASSCATATSTASPCASATMSIGPWLKCQRPASSALRWALISVFHHAIA